MPYLHPPNAGGPHRSNYSFWFLNLIDSKHLQVQLQYSILIRKMVKKMLILDKKLCFMGQKLPFMGYRGA